VTDTMKAGDSISANLVEMFRHFARCRSSGEVRELPGVSIASSGVNLHSFNGAFFSGPPIDDPALFARAITIASVHYAARHLRWAFWADEQLLAPSIRKRSDEIFAAHGMGLSHRNPGMAARRLRPPLRPLPDLEVRRVRAQAERLDFAFVNAVAFGLPFDWCQELYDLDSLWQDPFAGWVGYVDGRPVTTAAALAAAGAIGLYCVGTLDVDRHRGYGEAIVRRAIEHAWQDYGIGRVVLESSPAGLNLYEQMGFRTVRVFSVYGD
jgi:ribosomal protein S18 acetylase RimI-like enzyme